MFVQMTETGRTLGSASTECLLDFWSFDVVVVCGDDPAEENELFFPWEIIFRDEAS